MTKRATPTEEDIERSTVKRITLRVVPFLMLCYLMAYVDRANVGMASLQMNQDLGLSPKIFGFAASLFFVSYFIFEVPGNLLLQRFGARRWIARIMISWGAVTLVSSLINSATSFYVIRFLLGAAEAGFFPGILLYLSFWMPARYRARTVALFMTAMPMASIVGPPISAGLLHLDGMAGLRGWQWLFVLEGVATIFLGVLCLKLLDNSPKDAKWLSTTERQWLVGELTSQSTARNTAVPSSFWKTLFSKYVLCLALVNTCSSSASVTLAVWQPQLLKSFGLSVTQIGFLSAVPYVVASMLMVYWGRRSDRTGERRWHTVATILLIAAGCLGVAVAPNLVLTMVSLCAIAGGMYSLTGPFWAIASSLLSNRAAAVGLAGINALSNLIAGGLMVNVYGWVKESTGSASLAMLPLAALNIVGLIALYIVTRRAGPVEQVAETESAATA